MELCYSRSGVCLRFASPRPGLTAPAPRCPPRPPSLLLLLEPTPKPAEQQEHHSSHDHVDREHVPGVLGASLVVEAAVEGGVGDAARLRKLPRDLPRGVGLLPVFLDRVSGAVFLDGRDITGINPAALRSVDPDLPLLQPQALSTAIAPHLPRMRETITAIRAFQKDRGMPVEQLRDRVRRLGAEAERRLPGRVPGGRAQVVGACVLEGRSPLQPRGGLHQLHDGRRAGPR